MSGTVTPGMWIVSLTIVASLWWRGVVGHVLALDARFFSFNDVPSRSRDINL
jgi:hypothetical protein